MLYWTKDLDYWNSPVISKVETDADPQGSSALGHFGIGRILHSSFQLRPSVEETIVETVPPTTLRR